MTFYNCKNLTYVVIPDSIRSIGNNAFNNCTKLESITIGTGVNYLGSKPFSGCNNLSAVYIKDMAKWCAIGFAANKNPLSYAQKLYLNGEIVTDLIVPDGVTKISDGSFYGCQSITTAYIPEGVKSIGAYAFEYCRNLTSVILPDTVESIGEYVFAYCSNLTTISIPSSVTNIGNYAFSNTITLKVKKNSYAHTHAINKQIPFVIDCDNHTDIEIRDAIEATCTSDGYTGDKYCMDCGVQIETGKVIPAAHSLEIRDAIIATCTTEGYTGDSYCTVCGELIEKGTVISALSHNIVNGVCQNCKSIGTCGDNLTWIFNSETGLLTISGSGYMTNWAVGTDVPWSSVRDKILSFNISGNVKNIGSYAFISCSNLKTFDIPNSIISIGDYAFAYCWGARQKTINIPDSVETVGDYAFASCHMSAVNIGNGVTTIGESAFRWCGYITELSIPQSVTSIGSYAFSGCTDLTSINIPEGVTIINERLFYDCTGLQTVNIIGMITDIGEAAFRECANLISINIPESVNSIGVSAFNNCRALKSLMIPKGVTSIGKSAFYSCPKLVLSVSENSYAHTYAVDNKIPYEIICEHNNTELRNTVAATHTESGYTGDIYCSDCSIMLESGTIIYADCDFNKDGIVDQEDTAILEQSSFEPENTASFDFDRDGSSNLSSFDKTVVKLLINGIKFTEMVDVNNDGATNILDLVRIKKLLAGADEEGAIDRDGDGNSDSNDTVFTRKFLLFVDPELYETTPLLKTT